MKLAVSKTQIPSVLKFLCKLTFSLLAIYLVLIKIDWPAFFLLLNEIDPVVIFLAFILYNIGQVISAVRSRYYLALIDIHLDNVSAVYLCYLGMFYNLFFPGSIGGDGYKVYFLKRFYPKSTLLIVKGLLGDRLNGFCGLLVVGVFCFFFNGRIKIDGYQYCLLLLGLCLSIVFYCLLQWRFLAFKLGFFIISFIMSITVQAIQGLIAVILVRSFGDIEYPFLYPCIFLCSSIVSQLPVSLGGVGTREVTLVYILNLLGISPNPGLAMALVFFMLQTLSNLIGLVCYYSDRKPIPVPCVR